MNNTVQYVIQHILANIPRAVLEEAFIPKTVRVPNTVDFYINDKIITGRVLSACNLFSGKKKRILVTLDYLEEVTVPAVYSVLNSTTVGVYRIPPSVREYRDISHVIEMLYPYSSSGFSNINYPSQISSGNTVGDLASDVLGSNTYQDVFVPPKPILLAGDLIKLEPPQLAHIDWMVEVLLKFDEDFTNMSQSAIKYLADLSLCATKTHVYNELILKIDKAKLATGQELSMFKEIVEGYRDEAEKFDDHLENIRGAMTADTTILGDIISMMF